MGVKTSYKKYACDEAYELVPSSVDPLVPFEVVRVVCNQWLPKEDHTLSITHDGVHVLQQLPFGFIEPVEFTQDHLARFRKCVDRIPKVTKRLEAVADWQEFPYPKFNTSIEYLSSDDAFLHLPLKDRPSSPQ